MSGPQHGESVVFVTGKLAGASLVSVVSRLSEEIGFRAHIVVAKISVAALMTTEWLIGKLTLPPGTDRVVLPGLCRGETEALSRSLGGVSVVRGPDDLRDLPEFFAHPPAAAEAYGGHDIEIIAEINNADTLSLQQIVTAADRYRSQGADVIDLGCSPGSRWSRVGHCVAELIACGLRVSIDSFDAFEVADAVARGAELVLSVNSTNVESVQGCGCEVVVIPDDARQADWLHSMQRTVDRLEQLQVRYRLDPILEPIGFGFAQSLGRYLATRAAFPAAHMLMGVGNITELTEADSAGMHALLVGFCQELAIDSVLTTEVIHWNQGAVRELDAARQLMKFAVDHNTLPKHVDHRLVQLRAGKPIVLGIDELKRLKEQIRDANFRLFAENGRVFAVNRDILESADDPFELFERLGVADPSHAFYLGWELMKAATALQLGKRYVQDQALQWGLMTINEPGHRDRRNGEAR